MLKKNKRANILTENVVFIILNVVFLTILVVFLFVKVSDGAVFEEKYSKQIALMIDSAQPGMQISLEVKDAVDHAESGWLRNNFHEAFVVEDNLVKVKLSSKGGYSYSFFNDVYPVLEFYPDNEEVVITIPKENE